MLPSAAYKLFCSILNNRLSRTMELNNGMADEQNGFRAGRSTGDHINSLSLILESRIKKKKKKNQQNLIEIKTNLIKKKNLISFIV